MLLFRRKVEKICDDLVLFSIANKHNSAFMLVNHVLIISDMFNYEDHFSFLYKNLEFNYTHFSYISGANVLMGLSFKHKTPSIMTVGFDNWHEKPHGSNIT